MTRKSEEKNYSKMNGGKSPIEQHQIGGGGEPCSLLSCDVTEEILRRLPVPSLMRAKSVCKAWNKAISATTFNLNAEETHHYFVIQHLVHGFQGIAFFSSALNRWFRIPLPWERSKWDYTMPFHLNSTELYLCGSAEGLYLFLKWDDDLLNRIPIIFNPVTKQCRTLPAIPLDYIWTTGTAVELIAQSGHFQVITLGFHESDPTESRLQLYNSTTDKWTDIPATRGLPITSFSERHRWTSAVHNGVVYFTNSYGHHLGCYDIASTEFQFKEIEGGLPTQMDFHDHFINFHPSLPSLVACSGKLLLVGRLEKKAGERCILGRIPFTKHTLVGIWELENNKRWSWSLIAVTPQDLLKDTVKSSRGKDFMVAASSDKILLTIKGSVNLLSLNLSSMEWNVFPALPDEDVEDLFPRRAVCGSLSIHKLSFLN